MNAKILLSLVLFLSTTISFGSNPPWGQTGHRTTGKIAENHLSRNAKRQVNKLLKGESLAFVSTFGDEIKSDKKYNELYTWHYINMALDSQYEDSEKNPQGDLVTGINKCISVLKNKNSTQEDKIFYLKMLVHFMGDLHQPMHIGRKEDKGGNTIQVQWFGNGSNLHRVWDTDMIEEWKMSYLELAENTEELSKLQIKSIQKGTVVDWVNDTHKLSKIAYASVNTGEKLRYRYSYDHFKTVRKQLQKGGIRLAKVLNDIFD